MKLKSLIFNHLDVSSSQLTTRMSLALIRIKDLISSNLCLSLSLSFSPFCLSKDGADWPVMSSLIAAVPLIFTRTHNHTYRYKHAWTHTRMHMNKHTHIHKQTLYFFFLTIYISHTQTLNTVFFLFLAKEHLSFLLTQLICFPFSVHSLLFAPTHTHTCTLTHALTHTHTLIHTLAVSFSLSQIRIDGTSYDFIDQEVEKFLILVNLFNHPIETKREDIFRTSWNIWNRCYKISHCKAE